MHPLSDEPPARPAPARRLRAALTGALLLLILLLGSVAEVLWVGLFAPALTPLMLLRCVQGVFTAGPNARIHYRWVALSKVSPDFLNAIWQMEDHQFFRHHGFNWALIQERLEKAWRHHRPVRGLSTISMQCARSLFLTDQRSWTRKGLEAFYTFLLEHLLSKERIFALYINVIELGDGIYGIEAAAEKYYRVHANQLTRDQAAMLASLPPFPRGWDPQRPSPRLQERFAMTLARMNNGGPILNQLGK